MTTDMNPVSPIQQDERRSGVVREWYGRDRRDCALGAKSKFHQYREFWEKRMIGFSTRTAGRSTRFGVQSVGAILGVLFFLLTLSASAQTGYSFYGQVVDQTGKPAPFATVRICAYSGAGNPCFPLASIYSDPALTHQIANPTTTDSRGNYNVFLAGGYYITQITVPGSGTYSYVLSAAAASGGGGVVSINGVEGAFTFSGPGVTCAGTTCVFTGTGGSGSPGLPGGSAQFSNLAGTAFVGSGSFNTDIFDTGSMDNGIVNFGSSSNCLTTSCSALVQPSSTSTEESTPILPTSTQTSSIINDQRGNALSVTAINPKNPFAYADVLQSAQSLYPDFVAFTLPAPGPIEGSPQATHNHIAIYTGPGFSNGFAGCPQYCPMPPYTDVGQWTPASDNNSQILWNTSGIRQTGGIMGFCYGTGDCTLGTGYNYSRYGGGFHAPSDEGFYGDGANTSESISDFQCTLSTVTDINHIFCTPTVNPRTQGQGRFLIDTAGVKDASGNLLAGVPISASWEPNFNNGLPYANVVVNSANFPVSYGQGQIAAPCAVPAQLGGLAETTCTVTVTSGAFDTNAPACFLGVSGNIEDMGVKITNATALSGGSQTLTMQLHRSLGQVATYAFQGGMCGAAIELGADDTFNTAGAIKGSVFPVMGSVDAHTVAVVNYNSSQVAGNIPNLTSLFVTDTVGGTNASSVPGGYSLVNLVRTSGIVTAQISGGTNTYLLNGLGYTTITGCADTTFNEFQNPNKAYISSVPATLGKLVYTAKATGLPDSTCASAVITSIHDLASFEWAAEVYDVANHAPGVDPIFAADGTMTVGWQPNWVIGDAMDMPPHYAAAAAGRKVFLDITEPTDYPEIVFDAYLGDNTAYEGAAFSATSNATAGLAMLHMATQGGVSNPSDLIQGHGLFGNGLNMDSAPAYGGAIIKAGPIANFVQFTNPDGGASFLNYDVISLEGTVARLHYDEPLKEWSFRYNATPQPEIMSITPTTINSYVTHLFANAQFEIPSGGEGPLLPSGQIITCNGTRNGPFAAPFSSISPPCFDNVVEAPTVTAVMVGTPPTAISQYYMVVHFPYGDSWSPGVNVLGPATINSTNYNQISCSVIPVGMTGTVYAYDFVTGNVHPVTTATCASSAGVVNDQGAYGTGISGYVLSASGELFGGAFVLNGAKGIIGWGNPDTSGGNSSAIFDPTVVHTQISQLSAGNLSVDTTTAGDGLGVIHAAGFVQGGNTIQPSAFTTGGVTVSGTGCTITAITNGIITGATCP